MICFYYSTLSAELNTASFPTNCDAHLAENNFQEYFFDCAGRRNAGVLKQADGRIFMALEDQPEGGFFGFLQMDGHHFRCFFPVFLKAGPYDIQMFPESIFHTIVGDISCHIAEPCVLGPDQVVIVPDVRIGAALHNHKMKIGVQIIEIVVVLEIFAVCICLEGNIIEFFQTVCGQQRAVI